MNTVARGLDRDHLIAWYRANRARSASIFASITPEAYYVAPIPLRHPFVFYDGHLPGFSYIVLHRNALGGGSLDPVLESLFQRGIDPENVDRATTFRRDDWPCRDAVDRFTRACDDAVLADLATAPLEDDGNPLLRDGEAAFVILEHEPMHHETLLYIVNQLPLDAKHRRAPGVRDVLPPQVAPVTIPAGTATLGLRRGERFGWDNEFDAHEVTVGAFDIDVHDVTNGAYLAFVRDGGNVPAFWVERDGGFWLRTVYDEIPLPLSWPVYVSHADAEAYCRWAGGRLPTEAEYHRAAFGTPWGNERAFPWGDDTPSSRYGNFDFKRFDPEPVGSSPAGASAFGVHDLIGNGWEWTATPFAPFDGFTAMPTYPVYSADFFDGKHYVMKGASPVTSHHLVRRSFRNWFFADYPYMFATFRRVYD